MALLCYRMRQIPRALGCRGYLSVWRKEGASCVEHLAAFPPTLFSVLSTVHGCDGFLSSRGRWDSWLGCQVLPAIGQVSILEVAANSGSSRISQAPNLHLATQLLNVKLIEVNNNLWLKAESISCK